MRRKGIIISILVIMIISMVIGVSYAYWTKNSVSNSSNVITTTCFDISLSGENDINLVNSYPISDEEGMKGRPYTFTITNTCDAAASYEVNLEALEGTTFKNSSIKVYIAGSYKLYSSYNDAVKKYNNSVTSKKIVSGILMHRGESVTYNIRVWIDSQVGNDEQNKKFNSKLIITSEPISVESFCKNNIGATWDFDYVEDVDGNGYGQKWISPCQGSYKVELWGAQGGVNYNHLEGSKVVYKDIAYYKYSLGGYTEGTIDLTANKLLYFYVGETGNYNGVSTFNGGGKGGYVAPYYVIPESVIGNVYTYFGNSGGGATDVRLDNGLWNNFDSLKSRIMVAAGGGGDGVYDNSGQNSSAGGLIGYKGNYYSGHGDKQAYGSGGTQVSGGAVGNNLNSIGSGIAGDFGIGGDSNNYSSGANNYGNLVERIAGGSGGGGGGYYGGGPGGGTGGGGYGHGGGGGSSYISGHNGCKAITSTSTKENITHKEDSVHYSNYQFSNTKMIDGQGYNWTTEKGEYVGQVQPDGTTKIGHIRSGYARITYLGNK